MLSGALLGFSLFSCLLIVKVLAGTPSLDYGVWQTAVNMRQDGWTDAVLAFTHSFNTLPMTVVTAAVSILGSLLYRSWGLPAWVPWLGVGVTMLVSAGLVSLLKVLVTRQRPPAEQWLTPEETYSFPSGHSTSTATLMVTLVLLLYPIASRAVRIWAGVLLGLLAVAVALSRVYVGVHWFTDIVAGLALGVALACTGYLLVDALLRRAHPTPPGYKEERV